MSLQGLQECYRDELAIPDEAVPTCGPVRGRKGTVGAPQSLIRAYLANTTSSFASEPTLTRSPGGRAGALPGSGRTGKARRRILLHFGAHAGCGSSSLGTR